MDGLFDLPGRPAAVSGGSLAGNAHASAPLAVRMRPRTLDELVGQAQLRAEGAPLRQLIEGDQSMSLLLWGPPGSGKTTIASILSRQTDRRFVEVSAVSAGVKEVRAAIDAARSELVHSSRETVLFIDEVHRFSKAQQDALLPGVENRWVTLVAATTENPFFSVISPLLSRSLLLRLEPLTDADVRAVVDQALVDERGLAGAVKLDEDAAQHLVRLAGGDARRSLTYLEASAGAAHAKGATVIDLATAETAVDQAAVRYDRQGDQHYDVISAFIKSLRGSDADAALHYLARMLEAGEDPRFIARRLVILASEDIGLADPSALTTAVAAAQAVQLIGMPEAQLNLAQATIALAVAPKSNAVVKAIGAARADVQAGKIGSVPPHLRDAHYPGAKAVGHGSPLHLQPRPALRDRRTAVRARRGPRRRVLPADEPGRRGGGQGALGADQTADPRLRRPAIGSGTVNQPLVVPWIGACCAAGPVLIGYLMTVRRARRELAETRREAAELRSRIEGLAARWPNRWPNSAGGGRTAAELPAPDPTEYVITADRVRTRSRPRAGAHRRPAVRRHRAARSGGPGRFARPRRTTGPGTRDPQPDPVRDASRGQAFPQATARRPEGRPPRLGGHASAPAARTGRERGMRAAACGSWRAPARGSTRWCVAAGRPRR